MNEQCSDMSSESLLRVCLLALGLSAAAVASQPPCVHGMSVSLANGTKIKDGSILFDGLSFPLEAQFELNGELRGCPCMLKNCIRRCCPPGELLDANKCHQPNSTYNFDVPQLPNEIFDPEIKNYEEHFYIIYSKACFTERLFGYRLVGKNNSPSTFAFFVNQNGSLEVKNKKTEKFIKMLANDWYCIAYSEKEKSELFAWCPTPIEHLKKSADIIILWSYAVGCWLSAISLIMTFAIYVMFASLRNLHGQILMVYVACLIGAYIFSPLITQETIIRGFSGEFCTVVAYIVHFSFLASFFWLNVMCFDIWWTFGMSAELDKRLIREIGRRGRNMPDRRLGS